MSAPSAADRAGEQSAIARAGNSQRAASDPASSAWVSANAGTGKTTVLVKRVLRLLLAGVAPHRILCITYTKAAAAEMANRIDRELIEWATIDDAALGAALAELAGRPADAALRRRARQLFHTVLEAPGGLQIATIHAFCQDVLKRFPVEAGIAPHFAVIDERDAAAALADARRQAIEAARDADGAAAAGEIAAALSIVASFANEDQFGELLGETLSQPGRLRRAIGGDFAAFAGRVHAALGLAPGESEAAIAAGAGALEAASETALRRVAAAMLKGSKTDIKLGETIAAWLAAPAERPARFADYLSIFFIGGGQGKRRDRLITKSALEIAPDGETILSREAERLELVRGRIRAARIAAATVALFRLAGTVLDNYEAYKHSRAALDFDDLIERTRALLESEAAGAEWVLYKLDGGIDHLMIDEAQDTSPAQWALIGKIVAEIFAGKGRDAGGIDRTLFVVGDFKQSIYSFQGAAPRLFEAMRQDFKARADAIRLPWRNVDLDVSFRSVRAVLDAVDLIFAQPAAADGVAPSPGAVISHLTARSGRGGIVEVWPTVSRAEPAEDAPWSLPRVVEEAPDPDARLAAAIADRVKRAIASGELVESLGRPLHAGDVMILVRRRGNFMERMVSALKQRDIPVAGADRMQLAEQLVAQDLIALGRFLLLPDDDLTLAAVLKGPFFGMTDDDHLFPLAYARGGRSLWQRLGELARERGGDFAAARERLAALLDRADFIPPFELFAHAVEAAGGRRAILGRLGRDAEDALDEFLELALDYQRRHPPSLEGFLDWLGRGETEVKRDLEQTGRDEVRVMTVHGAKGLQAPIVFLADTTTLPHDKARILWPDDDGGVPLIAPVKDDETDAMRSQHAALKAAKAQEFRRLFYVALTRAADRLYVCGFENQHGIAEGSWYDLAARAFAASGIGETPFRFDDQWQGEGWRIEQHGAPPVPEAAPWSGRGSATPMEPWIGRPAPPEPAPPVPLAPSRPEAEPAIRSPFDDGDAARFRRGLLVHRLLETLPELPPAERAAAARRFLDRPVHGLAPEARDEIAAETLRLFDHPDFAALLGPGALAEVPLTGIVGDNVVTGQIDRLVIGEREILIVDYKTNRAPPSAGSAVPAAYRRQMALYRALLLRIYPGRSVRCFLLWTDRPSLTELSAASLESLDFSKNSAP